MKKKPKYPFWQPEQIFVAESELISYSQYNTISGLGQYDFLTKFEYFPVFNYSLLNKGPEAERRLPTLLLESIRNCYLWFFCTAFSTFLIRQSKNNGSVWKRKAESFESLGLARYHMLPHMLGFLRVYQM